MYCIRILLLLAAFGFCINAWAQGEETDSLKKALSVETDNQKRVSILENLSYAYLSSWPDTALQYALQGLQLSKDIKFAKGEAICTNAIGNVYFHTGDNAKALEMYLRYLKFKEDLKDFNNLAVAYFNISSAYTEEADYEHALYYLFKAKQEDEKAKDTSAILYDAYSLGSTYLRMNKTDSALYYINQSYGLANYLDDKNMIAAILNTFGEIYFALNDTAKAVAYYTSSIPHAEQVEDYEVLNANYYGLAKVYKQKGMLDSSVYYARKAFIIAKEAPFFKQALEVSIFLSDLFKMKNIYDSAFHYQEFSIAIKDSLFNVEQLKKVQELKFQEQQRQQSIETEKIRYHNNIKLFISIFVSVLILIIAIVLWRNNKEKQTVNLLLTQQKNQVEGTLAELRVTQAQLIQSEKMASLGELTAGIAHEIQNPLNFVNNFSEINKELLSEMKEEISKGNMDEVKLIVKDIEDNEEKINHHGKRAGAIVRGMLQHSRIGNEKKEPANINALTDECLRLTYRGFKTKYKTFTAEIKTDFDAGLEAINLVPQDIRRVLVNILNNAFYAVNEKRIAEENNSSGEQGGYQPTIFIETKALDDKVEIVIKDNGTGIPKNIINKIFQPFFTTKPTGQGTGLGLSLSYDIITKEHNGTLQVKSREGTGSEFIIHLPV